MLSNYVPAHVFNDTCTRAAQTQTAAFDSFCTNTTPGFCFRIWVVSCHLLPPDCAVRIDRSPQSAVVDAAPTASPPIHRLLLPLLLPLQLHQCAQLGGAGQEILLNSFSVPIMWKLIRCKYLEKFQPEPEVEPKLKSQKTRAFQQF